MSDLAIRSIHFLVSPEDFPGEEDVLTAAAEYFAAEYLTRVVARWDGDEIEIAVEL